MAIKSLEKSSTIDLDRIVPSNLKSSSILSKVQVKTSPFNRLRQSWLSITLGLIAIAGVLVAVGATIVALAVHSPTTTTTTTTSNIKSLLYSLKDERMI
jgi:hypothetical protein